MGGRSLLPALALGQVLSFLIAATATTSTLLANQGISAPTLQSALNYLLLAAVYTCLHRRQAGRWLALSKPWWTYALLSLLDVEGNFLQVLAYRYTSLTSVTLLDCFTIPMAVLLSALALGARYRAGHWAGAAVALAGLALLVLTDRGGSGGLPHAWAGDVLVLLGATLYASCNVVTEWLLGDVSVFELLAMQGLFGVLWSCLQGLPLELRTLLDARWTAGAALPFLGFGASMFCFYSLVPHQLNMGGAALLNLSLLTSDLWTALARVVLFDGFQGNSFFFFALSFLIIAAGIVVYSSSGDVYARSGDEGSGDEGAASDKPAAPSNLRRRQHHPPAPWQPQQQYQPLGAAEEGAGAWQGEAAGKPLSPEQQGEEEGLQADPGFAGGSPPGLEARQQQQQQQQQPAPLVRHHTPPGRVRTQAGGHIAAAGSPDSELLRFGIESPPALRRGIPSTSP